MTCRMGVHDAHSVAGQLARPVPLPGHFAHVGSEPGVPLAISLGHSAPCRQKGNRRNGAMRPRPAGPCRPGQWRRIPTVGVGSKPVGAAVLGLMRDGAP